MNVDHPISLAKLKNDSLPIPPFFFEPMNISRTVFDTDCGLEKEKSPERARIRALSGWEFYFDYLA